MAAFEYKCRRCGKIESKQNCNDACAFKYLLAVLYNITVTNPEIPLATSFHNCEDGNVGISDLIGYHLDSQGTRL